MTADVVNLADRRPSPNPGNGAREALHGIFKGGASMDNIDLFLAELWRAGFAVLPIDADGSVA
jgi:hypothetical protein